MRPASLLCATFLLVPCTSRPAHAQNQAELTAINKVIDSYNVTEDAGDMMAQAKLMTVDRVWVGPDGRRTDQGLNMRMQQAQMDEAKKFAPDMRWFTEARDRLIKIYGNGTVAVASFYWYRDRAIPGELPIDKARALGNPPDPAVITHVLVKDRGQWKIAHTQVTPMNPPDQVQQ